MPGDSSTLLNTVVAVVFFGGLFALAFHLHTRARRILEAVASRRGLHFSEGGTSRAVFPSERAVPRKGRLITCRPEVRWRLEGEVDEVGVSIYKMVLRTGTIGQPDSRTWGYPRFVGRFVAPGVDLPRTLLEPRSMVERIARKVFRIAGGPLAGSPLVEDFRIETDSVEASKEIVEREVGLEEISGGRLTFEGFANEFFLIEKPSSWRFLTLTERRLDAFLMLGVGLAKRLDGAGKSAPGNGTPPVAGDG